MRRQIHTLIGLVSCILLSCQREEAALPQMATTEPVIQAELAGIWVEERDGEEGQTYQRTLHFISADSIEMSETVLDKTSRKLLGYFRVSKGSYHLIPPGRSIAFSFTAVYQLEQQPAASPGLVNREDLPLSQYKWNSIRPLKLNARKDTLTLLAPLCNDTGNCVGDEIFIKQ